ncbi:hypothetical protein HHI36_013270, partial [Cryptolaemus montrouzieri]
FTPRTFEAHIGDHGRRQHLTVPITFMKTNVPEKRSQANKWEHFESLTDELAQVDWKSTTEIPDPEDSFNKFFEVVNAEFKKACPVKKIKILSRTKVQWYTKNLMEMKKGLDVVTTVKKTVNSAESNNYYKILKKE